jgi:hypothetical protein
VAHRKYLSLEEARNLGRIDQFCKEYPSVDNWDRFIRLFEAMVQGGSPSPRRKAKTSPALAHSRWRSLALQRGAPCTSHGAVIRKERGGRGPEGPSCPGSTGAYPRMRTHVPRQAQVAGAPGQ